MKLTHKFASFLRRPRPLTRSDVARITDWVSEGGSFDPAGPPQGIDEEPNPDGRHDRRPAVAAIGTSGSVQHDDDDDVPDGGPVGRHAG